MPRRLDQPDFTCPFHVSGRSINREWFELPMDEVWRLMTEQLYFMHNAYKVKILSFVLMANHYHLLIRAPSANLSEGMSYFTRETSRELAKASHRINMSYGGRFFRANIMSYHYYLNAYKYVYRNPVEAGLVKSVEDYRWSTLRGLVGLDHLIVPIEEDTTLFSDVEGTLAWLNRPVDENDWQSVRKALRRRVFQLAKNRNTKHPNRLELHLL